MMVVNRRTRLLLFLTAMAVVLGGCGGLDAGDAISVGDEGVSFEQLTDLAGVLDPAAERGGTIDAESLRNAAAIWVQVDAALQALGEVGVSMSNDSELATEQRLARLIAEGSLGPTTPSAPGYDRLVEFMWLQNDPEASEMLQTSAALNNRIVELLGGDIDSASKLGSWDSAAFRFVGPAGASPTG